MDRRLLDKAVRPPRESHRAPITNKISCGLNIKPTETFISASRIDIAAEDSSHEAEMDILYLENVFKGNLGHSVFWT